MRTMMRVLFLAVTLGVPSLSAAQAPQFAPPPLDRRCELLGDWAATFAQARTAGSDYYSLLELVMRQEALTPPQTTLERRMWVSMINNVLLVHQMLGLSPAQNRYETEQWCQQEISHTGGASGETLPQARE
jgi:hypothetical protein